MESADSLLPLKLFCEMKGAPLPMIEEILGYEIPFPERHLLVHDSDMTSRLENFFSKSIRIDRVQKKHRGDTLEREVILRLEEFSRPVEYGAIQIDLSHFTCEVRDTILESDTPFGGILNRNKIPYKSSPQKYFRIRSDEFIMSVFYLREPHWLYGRCNRLIHQNGNLLADVVEMLPPMDFFYY